MKNWNFITLMLIMLLLSCSNKKQGKSAILHQDTMQAVLWDVIRADALSTQASRLDSTKKPLLENAKLQQAIFAYHKISREQFYNSFNYYKSNAALMRAILDSMINKANRERVTGINPIPLITPAQ
ncbi:MAG: DUF4296 domain-containing protein [Chitinophagaceae bacterium]